VSLEREKNVWVARAALACTILLLAVTWAQAAHSCGAQILDSSGAMQLRSVSANTTLCLTCLMAQSAAAGFVFLVLYPSLRRCAAPSLPRVRPRSFLDSFHLWVRPPPAN
jgi:hypothetical protein